MRFCTIIAVILLHAFGWLFHIAHAQASTWQRIYFGGGRATECLDVLVNSKNNVVATGFFRPDSGISPLNNLFFLEVNGTTGEIIRTQLIRELGFNGLRGTSIIQAADNEGYVISGDLAPNNERQTPIICRLEANGRVRWAKRFNVRTTPNQTRGHIYKLVRVPNQKEYVGLGYIQTRPGNDSDLEDAFLFKINEEGALLWAKNIEFDAQDQDRLFDAVVDKNGVIYVVGMIDNSTGVVAKFNRKGELMWARELAVGEDKAPLALDRITLTPNGKRLFIAGRNLLQSTNTNPLVLVELDTEEGEVQRADFFKEVIITNAVRIKAVSDNRVVCFINSVDGSDRDYSVLVADASNTMVQPQRTWGRRGQETMFWADEFPDGYVMAGHTNNSFSFMPNQAVYLVKSDGNFNAGQCNVNQRSRSGGEALVLYNEDIQPALETIATLSDFRTASAPVQPFSMDVCRVSACDSLQVNVRAENLLCNVTARFSVQVRGANPNQIRYAWDLGNGQTSDQPFPTTIYTRSDTFIVRLTVRDESTNCSTEVRLPIFVAGPCRAECQRPQARFTAAPTTVCVGQAVRFTNTSLRTNDNTTYRWSFGDAAGGTASTRDAGYTYTSSGNYRVRLTVSNGENCTDTFSVMVRVNTATIRFTPTEPTVCPGSTSVTVNLTGAQRYTWEPSTGLTLTNNNGSSALANPSETTTYTVIGTDANGCTGTTLVTVSVGSIVNRTLLNETFETNNTLQRLTNLGWSFSQTPNSRNYWTVNNLYTGTGAGNIPTPNQSPSVTQSPQSNYLHITSGSTPQNAFFVPNGPGQPTTTVSATTPPLQTTDLTNITLQYYYLSAGGNGSEGRVEVSINNGEFKVISGGVHTNVREWTQVTLRDTDNQWANTTIRFRFTWVTGSGGNQPPFSLDNIIVRGRGRSSSGVTVSPDRVTTCYHPKTLRTSPVTLTANGATDFSWLPTTGLNTTTAGTVIATPTQTTTYTVIGRSGTCQSTATVTVVVQNAPDLVSSVTGKITICPNSSGRRVSITGAETYTWIPPTGVSNPNEGTVILNPTQSTQYRVVGTNRNGTCRDSLVVDVEVASSANLNVSATSENAKCAGQATGSITINATGGTTPYTYGLSATIFRPGTGKIINLAPGSYTVFVRDANGCIASTTATVSAPAPLAVTITQPAEGTIGCSGQRTGILNANVTGGTKPYQYAWSRNGASFPGNSGQSIANLPIGRYNVIVTDTNGCTATASYSVTSPTALNVFFRISPISCFEQKDGAISLFPEGGTPGYKYAWQGGAVGRERTGLAAGTYTVTVTDDRGCTAVEEITLTQPTQLKIKAQSEGVLGCGGVNDASAIAFSLANQSGTPPYTFLWSTVPAQTTSRATKLTAGLSYGVTVTDSRGCTATDSVDIEPVEPLSATMDTDSGFVSCAGTRTGILKVTATGGKLPYRYRWSNNATTAEVRNLAANRTYTVTVTDGNGCTVTRSAFLEPVTGISVRTVIQKDVSCFGLSDGAVTLEARGGAGTGYTYTWLATNPGGAATGASRTGLRAGVYLVQVNDIRNCVYTTTVTILQPPVLRVSLIKQDVSCFGQNNGRIDARVTGGKMPYRYEWTGRTATGASATNLAPGLYRLSVTDTNGCTVTDSVRIQQPDSALRIRLNQTTSRTALACFGDSTGQINLTVAGGRPPYTFFWNHGKTTQNLNNIKAGRYRVRVQDASDCVDTLLVTITQPPALTITVDSVRHVACNGAVTGAILTTLSGGTPFSNRLRPYRIRWSNGDSTASLNNIRAGVYTLTVTDANNCVRIITRTLTQPDTLKVTATNITQVACHGATTGRVSLNVTGGRLPYRVRWSLGGTLQTGLDNVYDARNLAVGVYTATVTDGNNCTTTLSATLTSPAALTVPLTITHARCFNTNTGSVVATPAGGRTPYRFSWSIGAKDTNRIDNLRSGNYALTVTDANLCTFATAITITQPNLLTLTLATKTDLTCGGVPTGAITTTTTGGTAPFTYRWSDVSNSTTPNLNNIAAGRYTVTVTDRNNCTSTLVTTIEQNTPLVLQVRNISPITCFRGRNGSVEVRGTGGRPPFRYVWSTGSTDTLPTLRNLAASTVTVTITDANNCQTTSRFVINHPDSLMLSLNRQVNIACPGDRTGEIYLTVSGGARPYTYRWTRNNASTTFTTRDLAQLAAGSYRVTVTDSLGCTNALTVNITQPQPLVLTAQEVLQPTCNGLNDGSITLNVTGGTNFAGPNPYTYQWSVNGRREASLTTPILNNLVAANYLVTVTDANNCTRTLRINLGQPDVLTAEARVSNVTCNGGENGAIILDIRGGTPRYDILWQDGATSDVREFLSAGNYNVTILDNNNCMAELSIEVRQPQALTLGFNKLISPRCNGDANGEIDLQVGCGTAPYTFQWSNRATTKNISRLRAGFYTVTVTDANGCVNVETFSLEAPQPLTLTLIAPTQIRPNTTEGTITASVKGGSVPYRYSISGRPGFQSDSVFRNLGTGSYTVTVRDEAGCSRNATVQITAPNCNFSATVTTVGSTCPNTDGRASVAVSGGVEPYNLAWSNGLTAAQLFNLAPSNYTVTVTDAQGCTFSAQGTVVELGSLSLSAQVFAVGCTGVNDGEIEITPIDGVPPYTYTWLDGQTLPRISNLGVGTYSVEVVDANRCRGTLTVGVGSGSAMTIRVESVQNVGRTGDSDGAIRVSATGGSAPYSYTWSNGATAPDVTGLSPGEYDITVTDAKRCFATTRVRLIRISDLSLTVTSVDATFGAANGRITAVAVGGAGQYTFSLTGFESNSTGIFNNVPAGTYTLVVTDADGSTRQQVVNINNVPCPRPGTIRLLSTTATTATLDWGAVAGATRYQIRWRAVGEPTFRSLNATTPSITLTGLTSGTRYEIRVRTDCGNNTFSTFTDTFSFTQLQEN